MTGWKLALTAVLLLANGYYVGLEFALAGSRRSKLEALADEGSRRARAALAASSDLTMQMVGAQLGVTVASLGLGLVGGPTVAHLLETAVGGLVEVPEGALRAIGLVAGLGIVVSLHVVIGEVVPKNLSLAGPERALLWMAPVARLYLKAVRPLVRLLQRLANAGMRSLNVEPRDDLTSAHTAEELAVMLAQSHEEGLIEAFAHDLLAGVLDFGDRDVASVMVPRDRVVAVSRRATVSEIEQVVVRSGHSRLPVIDGDLDTVLGFVHAKDLLTLPGSAHDRPLPLRLVRRMLVVPSDRSLEELLLSMRKARIHFAVVVDTDRTTVGVVTLEDLLEELVGDILDETDREARAHPTGSRGAAAESRPADA
jgi:CBS domain containing-hemolysin-like protein